MWRSGIYLASFFGLSAAVALSTPAAAASVSVIWDQTPGATGGTPTGLLENNSSAQNFGDPVSFAANTELTGFDVYTGYVVDSGVLLDDLGTVGTPVVITIHTGSASGPVTQIDSTIDVQGESGAPPGTIPLASGSGAPGSTSYYVRAHPDLPSSFQFAAGTYGVGMSGENLELGQGMMTIGATALPGAETSQYQQTTLQLTGLTNPHLKESQLAG
jgi:hypothetical protein